MDFVEGLPESEGYDTIMVVVDSLTKFSHFVPLCHPFTAAKVARAFWESMRPALHRLGSRQDFYQRHVAGTSRPRWHQAPLHYGVTPPNRQPEQTGQPVPRDVPQVRHPRPAQAMAQMAHCPVVLVQFIPSLVVELFTLQGSLW